MITEECVKILRIEECVKILRIFNVSTLRVECVALRSSKTEECVAPYRSQMCQRFALNVRPSVELNTEECVKILRIFNVLKSSISNVSPSGRMVY